MKVALHNSCAAPFRNGKFIRTMTVDRGAAVSVHLATFNFLSHPKNSTVVLKIHSVLETDGPVRFRPLFQSPKSRFVMSTSLYCTANVFWCGWMKTNPLNSACRAPACDLSSLVQQKTGKMASTPAVLTFREAFSCTDIIWKLQVKGCIGGILKNQTLRLRPFQKHPSEQIILSFTYYSLY